jgi:hypothetical protein
MVLRPLQTLALLLTLCNTIYASVQPACGNEGDPQPIAIYLGLDTMSGRLSLFQNRTEILIHP